RRGALELVDAPVGVHAAGQEDRAEQVGRRGGDRRRLDADAARERPVYLGAALVVDEVGAILPNDDGEWVADRRPPRRAPRPATPRPAAAAPAPREPAMGASYNGGIDFSSSRRR